MADTQKTSEVHHNHVARCLSMKICDFNVFTIDSLTMKLDQVCADGMVGQVLS